MSAQINVQGLTQPIILDNIEGYTTTKTYYEIIKLRPSIETIMLYFDCEEANVVALSDRQILPLLKENNKNEINTLPYQLFAKVTYIENK